jgi:cold shock CspA family protein
MTARELLRRGLRAGLAALIGAAALIPSAAAAQSIETVRDEFNEIAFDGEDGTRNWSNDWTEQPLSDGPTDGSIRIVTDAACRAGNCLRLGGNESAMVWPWIERRADLRGATTATLTFDYRRVRLAPPSNGAVTVMVKGGGTNWTTLTSYTYDTTDPTTLAASFDISPWIAKDTKVGFWATGNPTGYVFVDNVQIAYADENLPPAIDPPPADRSDPELVLLTYTIDATDPDGDDTELEFTASGLPNGLSIDRDTGVISGVPTHGAFDTSPHRVAITVTDERGASATATFVWTITGTNLPPTISTIPNQSIAEGNRMSVVAEGDDPNLPADTLSYSLVLAPSGATIDPGTGRIDWDTDEADGPGTYTFTVKVKDGASPPGSATTSFSVTVDEVNLAPQLGSITDQANGVGDTVGFTVAASDPDLPANRLRYRATGLPPGLVIGPTSGIISGTATTPGAYDVSIVVTDDGTPQRSDGESFRWDIVAGNHAPILATIPTQMADAGSHIGFTAKASDPDGDGLSFWMEGAPAGATLDEAGGSFSWTPPAAAAGSTLTFTLGVRDDGSPRLSDRQEVTIVVAQPNRPPEVNGVPDQVSAEGEGIDLAFAATDPDGDALAWTVSGLPPGLQFNQAGLVTGVLGYTAAAGSPYTVQVSVRDDGNPALSDEMAFEWTIQNTNRPPEIADQTVTVIGTNPTPIDVDATDLDGDPVTLTIVETPAGALTRAGSTFTYVAPDGFFGSDGFVVAADDGIDRTLATIRLTVRSTNAAPVAADDTYDVVAGTRLTVDAPGVLGSDDDADGDPLTAVLVRSTRHGSVDLRADGSFVYRARPDFTGTDEFEYRASDGVGGATTATVRIRVSPSPIVTAEEAASLTEARDAALTSTVISDVGVPVDAASEAQDDRSMSRAVLSIARESFATVPAIRFPLVLLLIALVLGLTIGRISIIPAGSRQAHGRGLVRTFDPRGGFGLIAPADGGADVFVHASALEDAESLSVGDGVEYLAGDSQGRPTATKVWRIAPV